MAGMNKIMIIGNCGRDPEMRYTPNGAAVTNFSVAVSRNWKTADGEQHEETDWFNIDCWNKLAEIANQYLSKGKQVFIEGRLHMRTYEDRNGEKRFSLDVRASDLTLLGQRGDQLTDDFAAASPQPPASTEAAELDAMPF